MRTARVKYRRVGRQIIAVFPFVFPLFLLMGMFTFYPLVRNIVISFSKFNIIQNQMESYVGLQNYEKLIHDSQYLLALRNTILYALITVPGQIFFGMVLACLINSCTKGKTFFKVITYLPVITSWVVVSMLFKYIFMSGKGGLFNYFLMSVRLMHTPVAWLQNEWTANMVLWLFGIWKGVGWVMIIYLAALQSISKDVYEAAQIDGTNTVQKYLYITVPLVRNTTLYLMTVLMIGAFGAYIHVMLITEGGPLGTTNQLMNYMYNSAFSEYDFGYSSAQAITMGLIIFVMTVIQRQVSKETVY